MIAPCTAPQTGLCFQSAPGKRQHERSTVPESDGIFMPGIRPDSGRCSKPVSMLGLAGCAFVRPRATLMCGFPARQFPAPRRFVPELWRLYP